MKTVYQLKCNKSKPEIWRTLTHKKEQFHKLHGYLSADTVDYRELKLEQDVITVLRQPTFFSPFRAYGRITFNIDENNKLLTCTIYPYNGKFSVILGLIILTLILWTVSSFLFGLTFNVVLMILTGWLAFGLVFLIKYKIDKSNLITYSKNVVREMKGPVDNMGYKT